MGETDTGGRSDPAAPDRTTLTQLAHASFPDLGPGEERVLQAAERGHFAYLGDGTADSERPEFSDQWGPEQRVRALLLRWLCTAPEATAKVDRRGVRIFHARVEGPLDLSHAEVAFPLELQRCSFTEQINLEHTGVAKLSLAGSTAETVWAVHLAVQGDLTLNDGFRAGGCVYLNAARIAGDLRCTGGHFLDSGYALLLAHAKVEGNVYLDGGFRSTGLVSLQSCVVGGGVHCSDARLTAAEPAQSPGGDDETAWAFLADQAEIKGSLTFRGNTVVQGSIGLISATVGRDIVFAGATLDNPGRRVVAADRISVGGDFFFHAGSRTNGFLRLVGARIDGDVTFSDACFEGVSDTGLDLEAATVGRSVIWRKIKKTDQTVLSLVDASAARILDDEESWPSRGNLRLYGFTYRRTQGNLRDGPRGRAVDLRRGWLTLLDEESPYLQPYEQLATVFRAGGHEQAAKQVLMDREDRRYRLPGTPRLHRLGGRILKLTIGYGYAPGRALVCAAVMMALGWLVFATAQQQTPPLMIPTAGDVYRDTSFVRTRQPPEGYQTFSPLVYSLDAFLPIVDLHQEDHWLPNPQGRCTLVPWTDRCGRVLRVYLWLHIAVGWALTTLAVAGFTGLVRSV